MTVSDGAARLRRRQAIASALVLSVALGGGAAAADKDAKAVRAAPLEAVLACRTVADDAARLACYDQAAGRMDQAERSGDIVVIDKAQAAAANRDAFGLHVPSLSVLTRALSADEANRYDGVVRAARSDASGHWTMSLEDGAVWRQIDGFLTRSPRSGSKVSVRKAALGSYLMNIDGQAAVRVHRDQ